MHQIVSLVYARSTRVVLVNYWLLLLPTSKEISEEVDKLSIACYHSFIFNYNFIIIK